MRILHTSDWHLGCKTDDLDRLSDQKDSLEQIVKIAQDNAVDMVVVAGDVYDQLIPSAEAENLFFKTISQLTRGGECAVVVVAGNHDEPKRLTSAQVFASRFGIYLVGYYDEIADMSISRDHQIYSTEVGKGYIKFETKAGEKCTVATLPWPNLYRYKVADSENANLSDKCVQWVREITSSFVPGENNILVGHVSLSGAPFHEFEDEKYTYSPYTVLSQDELKSTDLTYGAFGHVHHAWKVSDNVYYSGGIINTHFTQADAIPKSVNLVEMNGGVLKKVEIIPLRTKKLRVVRASSFEEVEAFASKYPLDYVKAIVEGVDKVEFGTLKKLKKAHSNLVTISVINPEEKTLASAVSRKDITSKEVFENYVLHTTGKLPDDDVTELFLEIMGEVVYEAD